MFKKLIASLSHTAIEIMYYGTFLSLGLLLIGIFSYQANILLWGESYINFLWSIKILTSSVSLFVQTFFFSLLFECVRLGQKP